MEYYDSFGRLVEISSFGSVVRYAYDAKGRVSRQTIDGSPIEYSYTKLGQLAGKYLGGRLNCDAAVEYEYSRSGKLIARIANGERQEFVYDAKGQLVVVKGPDGAELERYAYDKAGNMIAKTVGGKTTKFVFDGANQLMSSTSDGVTKFYAYDAAGRLVKEGDRTYAYGYLDKVMSVKDGDRFFTYTYYPDGQLRSADYGERSESFAWDGLALVKRGDERFINEPHVGGGNPVASSKGGLYFNDMLGTTVGVKNGGKYSAAALTAFGEDIGQTGSGAFFTGKPQVEGLGRVFWMRNYRASLGKWQTADPMGYPDGWNQLAYCNNGVTDCVDLWGCSIVYDISKPPYYENIDIKATPWKEVPEPYVTADGKYRVTFWEREVYKYADVWFPAYDFPDYIIPAITGGIGAALGAVGTPLLAGISGLVSGLIGAAINDAITGNGASYGEPVGKYLGPRLYAKHALIDYDVEHKVKLIPIE